MCALCTREERGWWLRTGRYLLLVLHIYALLTEQVHTRAPMSPSTPIVPEERLIPHSERMQQYADLARLCRRTAIPLTLLTERTGAATKDASSVHHTQAAVGFSALLMRDQFLVCWALKRSIGMEGKVLAREATGLPCGTHF
jgi:hypothetical protein